MSLNITKKRQGGNVQETKVITFADQTLIRGKDNGNVIPVKVDTQGRLELAGEISVDTVNVGAVQQGKRSESAEPWEVTLSGRAVTIGATTFRLLPDGNTLVGPAASRPSAADAVSAVGDGVVYWARDTGEVWQANGSSWRSLGVA